MHWRVMCAGVLLACLALAGGAVRAQVLGGDSGGTLGTLLNQLSELQESGALDRLGGDVTSTLDQSRERGLERGRSLQSPSPNLQQAVDQLRERSGELDGLERTLVQHYCAGELDVEQQRQVELIDNFSPVERDYCTRLREPIFQYGYELFGGTAGAPGLSIGAISPQYVLGVGDELIITFHGQENRTLNITVDREGRVVLPGFPPIPAAGRSFATVREDIESRTDSIMLGTDVYVSLGAVRAISVVVAGEVRRPGRYQLNGLSSIIDAIGLAGGVKKTGSIRNIQVQRNGNSDSFDSYDLLYGRGSAQALALYDGDRIVVPPLGPTVAVAGDVKRPGIYELAPNDGGLSIGELVALGGGPLRPMGNRFLHLEFDSAGRERVVQRSDQSAQLSNGEMLLVARGQNIQIGTVELVGHVRLPGPRSLASASRISELVSDVSAFKPDPYLLFAALERTDPQTQARHLVPVNLQAVFQGREDYVLHDHDRLIVLSADDIHFLLSREVQRIITESIETELARQDLTREAREDEETPRSEQGQQQQQTLGEEEALRSLQQRLGIGQQGSAERQDANGDRQRGMTPQRRAVGAAPIGPRCTGLERLRTILATTSALRYAGAVRTLQVRDLPENRPEQDCPRIFRKYGDLLPLALEHVVAVNGEVRRPGAYPVAGATPLDAVIKVAGGLTREVDLTRVELSRYAPDSLAGNADTSRGMVDLAKLGVQEVGVSPGDVVRFNGVFTDRETGPVLLAGEVVRPGLYEIKRGERLSELIARAGGLTEQAYPYGAIFTRESVRRQQILGFKRAARELNAALAATAVRRGVNPTAVLALQQLAGDLENVEALGRVVIEADPTVLQVRPELDIVLEPGDRLFMPKRPTFVTVIGDVLNPAALQFRPGSDAADYIRQAGGFQQSADEGRVFVVYPNGEAEPLSLRPWNHRAIQIPPGSLLVVPKDPTPFDFTEFVREGADLISKVAVTAASLAVIGRN